MNTHSYSIFTLCFILCRTPCWNRLKKHMNIDNYLPGLVQNTDVVFKWIGTNSTHVQIAFTP